MSTIVSKNPFTLLEDQEGDEATPLAPVKTVDKTSTHTSKRNTDGLAPSKGLAPTGSRRGGAAVSGNEAAFRDRQAGRETNRGKSTEEGPRGGRRGGFRGRGGSRREEGDRHPSKSFPHSNSEKQAAQSWGANEGQSELKDEQVGEEIAQFEQKATAEGEASFEVEAKEEDPEEKHLTLDQYLAQQAEKKNALGEAELKVRKPNEGVKEDKWKGFTPLTKDDEEDELFAGTGAKAKRGKERKTTKQFVELENRYIEPERPRGGRGGRGGGRGDGGRGRGRGAPRGDFGADFGGDFRGGRSGGRGQESAASINTQDEDAFPSLGSNH